jgi:hypothetical protein
MLNICFSVRFDVKQWLDRTIEHNEQVAVHVLDMCDISSMFDLHRHIADYRQQIVSFIDYVQQEAFRARQLWHKATSVRLFHARFDTIEQILVDRTHHSHVLMKFAQQMRHIDENTVRMTSNGNDPTSSNRLEQYERQRRHEHEQSLRVSIQHEYWQVQLQLGTRLELAIRTLLIDIDRLHGIINDRTVDTSLFPRQLTATKLDDRSLLLNSTDRTVVQRHYSHLTMKFDELQRTINGNPSSQSLMQREIVSENI